MDQDVRHKAIEVRDDHDLGTCRECYGIGPCSTHDLWLPIIATLPRPVPVWPGSEDAMRWWI